MSIEKSRDSTSQRELSTEEIRNRISQLSAQSELPIPDKPEDLSDPEQAREYRKKLLSRQIKTEFLKDKDGLYVKAVMSSPRGDLEFFVKHMLGPNFFHPDRCAELSRQIVDRIIALRPEMTRKKKGSHFGVEEITLSQEQVDELVKTIDSLDTQVKISDITDGELWQLADVHHDIKRIRLEHDLTLASHLRPEIEQLEALLITDNDIENQAESMLKTFSFWEGFKVGMNDPEEISRQAGIGMYLRDKRVIEKIINGEKPENREEETSLSVLRSFGIRSWTNEHLSKLLALLKEKEIQIFGKEIKSSKDYEEWYKQRKKEKESDI